MRRLADLAQRKQCSRTKPARRRSISDWATAWEELLVLQLNEGPCGLLRRWFRLAFHHPQSNGCDLTENGIVSGWSLLRSLYVGYYDFFRRLLVPLARLMVKLWVLEAGFHQRH